MFGDSRLPTLDTSIWINEKGQISHIFYEKPMCPNRVLQRETALAESGIRASLTQEVVRRLKNCSSDVKISEKQGILSIFAQKMINSGHSLSSTQYILVHGVIKYLELVRCSKLSADDPSIAVVILTLAIEN